MELWGSSQTLTASGSRDLRLLLIPVCSCLLLFSSALSPAPLFSFFLLFFPAKYSLFASFFSPYSSGGKHLFGMRVAKLLLCSRICLQFLPDSAAPSPDVSPIIPVKQEPVWFPLHPLGDCWRPSTVPLAPQLLSSDVIREE